MNTPTRAFRFRHERQDEPDLSWINYLTINKETTVSQSEPIQRRRVTLRGIIYRNGKLFCQMLKTDPHKENKPYWCIPGGGIDFGETLEQGLVREIIEETGVTPAVGRLLFVQQYHDGDKEFLEFFYEIKNVDDFDTIDLASTSHGLIEIEKYGFIDPKKENVLPAFLQTIDIEPYLGRETQPVFFYSQGLQKQ